MIASSTLANSMMTHNKPQYKAICLMLLTMSPKKPNSANRRVAKVKLTTINRHFTIKIPGEGHTLQNHSSLLFRGGKPRDLIGVNFTAIRGVYDLLGVKGRKQSKSKYGAKKQL